MAQEKEFTFGTSSYDSKKITASTLDEAVNEFILGCIDFSEFAYSNNPLGNKHLDEPIGYTNGLKNSEYAQHRFYELIPVYCGKKLVKEMTLTEFRNWHLRQENILENMAEPIDTKNELTAHSMTQMNRHIINTSMKIRKIKLDMALERKHNLLSTNAKMEAMQSQMEKVKKEYAHLQKKMNILKTYTGIGREIVKIRSGKKSDKNTIDIFQSFRYMKEDIEILTDFKDFDAQNLEDFDTFIKEHYQELLPSEKCIQAFKVTDRLIHYGDIFTQQALNKENKKVYLLIRNGENIYRIFNNYDLHSDYLFMLDDPTEGINQLVKELIDKRSFCQREDFEAIKDSYDAKISMRESKGELHSHGRNPSYYACEIPFEYDDKLLSKMKQEAEFQYNHEVARRETYIERFGLQDELNIYSWRWGISLGSYMRKCNEKQLKIRHKMEILKAYKENDYFTIYALLNNSIDTYMHFTIDDEKYELKPYDDGIVYTDYCAHRDNDDTNDFSDNFDIM